MTTNKEQGEKLLKEAQWIFERDLKGCLRMLGIDYPKVHDAGLVFVTEKGTLPQRMQRKLLMMLPSC